MLIPILSSCFRIPRRDLLFLVKIVIYCLSSSFIVSLLMIFLKKHAFSPRMGRDGTDNPCEEVIYKISEIS